jgi:hypothetical protein
VRPMACVANPTMDKPVRKIKYGTWRLKISHRGTTRAKTHEETDAIQTHHA